MTATVKRDIPKQIVTFPAKKQKAVCDVFPELTFLKGLQEAADPLLKLASIPRVPSSGDDCNVDVALHKRQHVVDHPIILLHMTAVRIQCAIRIERDQFQPFRRRMHLEKRVKTLAAPLGPFGGNLLGMSHVLRAFLLHKFYLITGTLYHCLFSHEREWCV
jgi:hypothetical protein